MKKVKREWAEDGGLFTVHGPLTDGEDCAIYIWVGREELENRRDHSSYTLSDKKKLREFAETILAQLNKRGVKR